MNDRAAAMFAGLMHDAVPAEGAKPCWKPANIGSGPEVAP
jgi:hypothetical protein